jgi:hypothetical protein
MRRGALSLPLEQRKINGGELTLIFAILLSVSSRLVFRKTAFVSSCNSQIVNLGENARLQSVINTIQHNFVAKVFLTYKTAFLILPRTKQIVIILKIVKIFFSGSYNDGGNENC